MAMTADELDSFLRAQRTCRVATVGRGGAPHVSPLWYVWDGGAVWLNSLVRSQRFTDLRGDPRVAIVIDAGETYAELHGAEMTGRAEIVGDVPRRGDDHAELVDPEALFAAKYHQGDMELDGKHAWVRVVPDKIASWDFRKLFIES